MRKSGAIAWMFPIIPLVLAGTVVWVGLQGYRQSIDNNEGRILMSIDPEVKSLDEAIRAAELIVVGRAVKVGETLLEATEDGWERPVSSPSGTDIPYTPYTDFRIEVADVVYATPDWNPNEEILLRVLGGSSTRMEPDMDHREDLIRESGKLHVFFLRRSLSPYDPATWRPVDSIHIFPFRDGNIHPNLRSLRWDVATIKSPMTVEELKERVVSSGIASSRRRPLPVGRSPHPLTACPPDGTIPDKESARQRASSCKRKGR